MKKLLVILFFVCAYAEVHAQYRPMYRIPQRVVVRAPLFVNRPRTVLVRVGTIPPQLVCVRGVSYWTQPQPIYERRIVYY